MILIETANFSLTAKQLVLALIPLIAGLGIIFLFKILFRQKRITKVLGEKQLKSLMNFIYIVVSFFSIYICCEILGIDFTGFLLLTIFATPDYVHIYVYHIFVLYLIIKGTKVLVYLIQVYIDLKPTTSHLQKGKYKSIYIIIKYFIYVIAISIFIQSIGFNVTIIIASLSALLVGVGLGVQHIFNDIISGFIILIDRSIKIDDIVEVESGLIGRIVKINLRTSILITRDDVEVIIPNRKFTGEKIINWTHKKSMSRFKIIVGVAYGSDTKLVEQLLIKVAKEHKLVADNPSPTVHFIDFGESSLNFRLMFFSEDNFRIEKIKSDLRFEIDKLFRENKIKIPFPQRDIHMFTENK